jgi:hypothetical protein
MSGLQPLLEPGAHERIIVQVRIGQVYTIDFFCLSRAKGFFGIQTPGAFQQSLSAEHFVQARDAAGKLVGRVEERRIAVGDLNASTQEAFRNTTSAAGRGLTLIQQVDCATCPH